MVWFVSYKITKRSVVPPSYEYQIFGFFFTNQIFTANSLNYKIPWAISLTQKCDIFQE